MGKIKQTIPDWENEDYDYDDDYDSGYTDYIQAINDRLDYARELYEAGEIDETTAAEIRVGA